MDTQKSYSILEILSRVETLKESGKDIINLSIGETDFNTPNFIKRAAIKALRENFTKYTAPGGIERLKNVICNKFKKDNKLLYKPEQILVSNGAIHSLYNFFISLLRPGDEVIIPGPYWLSYPPMIHLAGANPIIIPTSIDNGYKITPSQLNSAITNKTKLFILNSPCNPTGSVYTSQELKLLGEILRLYPNIWIASDDIYEKIIWTEAQFQNILNVCADLSGRTVVFNGVSKAHAMTGWRIGYAAGPQSIIKQMSVLQAKSLGSLNSIAQIAAATAINGPEKYIIEMKNTYKYRHESLYEGLKGIPQLKCNKAQGTFYLFPDISEWYRLSKKVKNDIDFVEYLLSNFGLAVAPGSVFGEANCIRISFGAEISILEQAIQKLKMAYESLLYRS